MSVFYALRLYDSFQNRGITVLINHVDANSSINKNQNDPVDEHTVTAKHYFFGAGWWKNC